MHFEAIFTHMLTIFAHYFMMERPVFLYYGTIGRCDLTPTTTVGVLLGAAAVLLLVRFRVIYLGFKLLILLLFNYDGIF